MDDVSINKWIELDFPSKRNLFWKIILGIAIALGIGNLILIIILGDLRAGPGYFPIFMLIMASLYWMKVNRDNFGKKWPLKVGFTNSSIYISYGNQQDNMDIPIQSLQTDKMKIRFSKLTLVDTTGAELEIVSKEVDLEEIKRMIIETLKGNKLAQTQQKSGHPCQICGTDLEYNKEKKGWFCTSCNRYFY